MRQGSAGEEVQAWEGSRAGLGYSQCRTHKGHLDGDGGLAGERKGHSLRGELRGPHCPEHSAHVSPALAGQAQLPVPLLNSAWFTAEVMMLGWSFKSQPSPCTLFPSHPDPQLLLPSKKVPAGGICQGNIAKWPSHPPALPLPRPGRGKGCKFPSF
jgi:hypothetical protein